MKFSEQWLRSWINPPVESKNLAHQLTMAGLEVATINAIGGEFTNVVVGEVLSVTDHPNSKRLHCCQVNIGEDVPLSIVCGASNVKAGLKVAVAKVGAVLPKNQKITQAELRGVLSSGMICSASELNLIQQFSSEDSQLQVSCNSEDLSRETKTENTTEKGILELPEDAPVGCDLKDYMKLQDHVFDIELTPNRSDCLSIRGIARETAILNNIIFNDKFVSAIPASHQEKLSIEIIEPKLCPRYVGRVIRNINPFAKTPIWMQENLRRSNIRSINPVVDITNFVMLELGQPMHAFDLEKLNNHIRVRLAYPNENLVLLDGKEIELDADTLVIADNQSPQAIAGIMGGKASGVTSQTKHLFLESAFFDPVSTSLTARRYGMQTDSSYRFARGVDYHLQVKAIERATALLLEIVGGEPGPLHEKISDANLPASNKIILNLDNIKKLLGVFIEPARIESILISLGMKLNKTTEGWEVYAPSYRFDISLEADLIEEIARIYGYQQIPAKPLKASLCIPKSTETELSVRRLSHLLMDHGYYEVITYSFIDPLYHQLLTPLRQALSLANPISKDLSIMRTSLWPGLVKAAHYNFNRQIDTLRLFEVGACFLLEDENWQQINMLGGLVGGYAHPEQWSAPRREVDFYDVKGDIESLLALANHSHFAWQASEDPALHPGQQAVLLLHGRVVGYLGAIHPNILQKIDLSQKIYVFEFNLDLLQTTSLPQFKSISKFPSIRRDIAIIVNRDLPALHIEQFIKNLIGEKLIDITIFDVYQGEKIAEGEKSIALGLTFQEISRTLTDTEINDIMANILQQLEIQFKAKLRI